jgi:type IV secretion system protein VirD4
MLNASDAREEDEEYKNPVGWMFEKLEKKDPEHFAVLQYRKYKMSAGKTAKAIM